MKVFQNRHCYRLLCICLLVSLILSVTASISFGAVNVNFHEVWKIIASKLAVPYVTISATWKKSAENIVLNLRLPRTILAILSGAGLSLCGILMQALTKNPLADPYVLGISSGASTGAVLIIICGGTNILGVKSVSLGAFSGALLSCILVFILARQNGSFSSTRLVLTGISMAALFSSITSFLVFTEKDYSKVHNALFWSTGSLSGADWNSLLIPALGLLICYIFIMLFSGSLNSMLLGEEAAITLGVNTKLLKNAIVILASMLTGLLVSKTGIIGFVGLIVPHIARTLVGSDHRKVCTISMLTGAIIVIWADLFARTVVKPEEIPIGIITSFLGAPFFIWLLRKSTYAFGGKVE